MKIYRIGQTKYEDRQDFYEEIVNQEGAILYEYEKKKGKGQKMKWEVVPYTRLKKIWDDRIKTGVGTGSRDGTGSKYGWDSCKRIRRYN